MTKVKLIELFVFLSLFGVMIFASIMLYVDYEDRITRKDKLIDSLQTENINTIKAYTRKIDSIAMLDTNYTYSRNGKEVSIASIIRSANQWYKEKEKFKYELELCNTNLDAYTKSYNELTSRYTNQSNSYGKSVEEANSIIKNQRSTIERYNPHKYLELDAFKNMINKVYGLSYKITKNSDSTHSISMTGNEKLDTALSVYNQMKQDKNFKIEKRKKD